MKALKLVLLLCSLIPLTSQAIGLEMGAPVTGEVFLGINTQITEEWKLSGMWWKYYEPVRKEYYRPVFTSISPPVFTLERVEYDGEDLRNMVAGIIERSWKYQAVDFSIGAAYVNRETDRNQNHLVGTLSLGVFNSPSGCGLSLRVLSRFGFIGAQCQL